MPDAGALLLALGIAGSKPGGSPLVLVPGALRAAALPLADPAADGATVAPGCSPPPAEGAAELAARPGASAFVAADWASVGRLQDKAVVISSAAGTLRKLRWDMSKYLSVMEHTASLAPNRVTWRAEMLAL